MKPRLAIRCSPRMTGIIAVAYVCLGAQSGLSSDDILDVKDSDFNNWATLSFGGAFVRGDDAAFMQHHGVPANEPFGGIEDLHLEHNVGKKGLLTVDGRLIYDNHDYLIKLGLQNPDIGYVHAGFREFRTWYDGSGGFFPPNNQWFNLYDDEMAIDRGDAWFEAGLTLPDKPIITFRYSHQFRDGKKDSTSWGDTTLTGLPAPNNNRKIVPSFYDVDEVRDTFELDGRHTIGKTDVGLGLRYERLDQDNTRVERRNPTQANDRQITQKDEVFADLFNAHSYLETRFNEKVLFTLGGSYTRLETDVGGSRVYSPATAPPLGTTDEGFVGLDGGSQMDQYVGNVSVMLTPREHLAIVPAIRVEHQGQDGDVEYGEVAGIAAPVPIKNVRERSFLDVSESLELRYTGLKNWSFTARAQLLEGQGQLQETERELEDPDLVDISRDTDSERFTQKYQIGANWYPHRRVNFAAQYYHKRVNNDYDHEVDSTTNAAPSGNRYPAYLVEQNFVTDDVNFRVTWRPCNNVTLISRYDYQMSTIDTRADLLSELQSGEVTSHIFSQSISWVPWSRLYLQANGTYSCDNMTTPANDLTGAAAGLVTRSKNGYWMASAAAGFVIDDKTDLHAQYSYYRADDYINNAATSQPYGADDEQHAVTVALGRRINKNLRVVARYGYSHYHDGASGGHNDYEAHLVASNLEYRF